MGNEEKTEVKKGGEWMSPETKTGLKAIGLLLISIASAFLVAYSDSFSNSNVIVGVILGGIWGGIVGGILGGIWGGILGVILGGIVGGILGVILGVILGGIVGEKKLQLKISYWALVPLLVILILPFSIVTVPLSKLHNYRQLERDQKIAEALQIRVLEDEVEVLLPDQYAEENSYLKMVFSFGWEGARIRWREIVIPCREGEKYWFYARLPFPESRTAKLEIFFDHAYQDFSKEITLK